MPQYDGGLIPRSTAERRVAGLRDYPIPSEVKVYNALTGELIRIEQPTEFRPENKAGKKRNRRNHD